MLHRYTRKCSTRTFSVASLDMNLPRNHLFSTHGPFPAWLQTLTSHPLFIYFSYLYLWVLMYLWMNLCICVCFNDTLWCHWLPWWGQGGKLLKMLLFCKSYYKLCLTVVKRQVGGQHFNQFEKTPVCPDILWAFLNRVRLGLCDLT